MKHKRPESPGVQFCFASLPPGQRIGRGRSFWASGRGDYQRPRLQQREGVAEIGMVALPGAGPASVSDGIPCILPGSDATT